MGRGWLPQRAIHVWWSTSFCVSWPILNRGHFIYNNMGYKLFCSRSSWVLSIAQSVSVCKFDVFLQFLWVLLAGHLYPINTVLTTIEEHVGRPQTQCFQGVWSMLLRAQRADILFYSIIKKPDPHCHRSRIKAIKEECHRRKGWIKPLGN